MPGPWERYQNPMATMPPPVAAPAVSTPSTGPWVKYTQQSTEAPGEGFASDWATRAAAEVDKLEASGQQVDALMRQAIVRKHQFASGAGNVNEVGRVQIDDTHSLPQEQALMQEARAKAEQTQGFLPNLGASFLQSSGAAAQNIMRLTPGLKQQARDLKESSDQLYGDASGVGGFLGSVAASTLQSVAAAAVPGATLPFFMASGAGGELLDIDQRRAQGEQISDTRAGIGALGVGAAEGFFEKFLGVPALKAAEEALAPAIKTIAKNALKGDAPAIIQALKTSLPQIGKAALGGAREEALTSIAQDIIRNTATNKGVTSEQILKNALYSAAAGGVGAIGGGGLHAGMAQDHGASGSTTTSPEPVTPSPQTYSGPERRVNREASVLGQDNLSIADNMTMYKNLGLTPGEADPVSGAVTFTDEKTGQQVPVELGEDVLNKVFEARRKAGVFPATDNTSQPTTDSENIQTKTVEANPSSDIAVISAVVPKSSDDLGAAQTPLPDLKSPDGTWTRDNVIKYISTMEGDRASVLTDMLADEPHVLVDAPLDKLKLAETGNAGERDANKLEDANDMLAAGGTAPPVVVGKGGFVADGTHRILSYQQAGKKTIGAVMPTSMAQALGRIEGEKTIPTLNVAPIISTSTQTVAPTPKVKTPIDYTRPIGSQFAQQGPGHTKWANALSKLVSERTLMPETADAIMATFHDTDDAFLGANDVVSNSKMRSYGRASPIPADAIAMQKGLGGKEPGQDFMTFLHEYGHISQHRLLTKDEHVIVNKVYNSKTRTQWRDWFEAGSGEKRQGVLAGEKHSFYSKYYASSPAEFFAQSFAEYVINNRIPDPVMKPLLSKVVDYVRDAVAKLTGRTDIKTKDLHQIFDNMLSGKSTGVGAKRWLKRVRKTQTAAMPAGPGLQALGQRVKGYIQKTRGLWGKHKRLVPRAVEDWITPISSRIRDISPPMFNRLKRMTFNANSASERLKKELHEPAVAITKVLGGEKSQQYKDFKIAVLNQDMTVAEAMLPQPMRADFKQFYTTFRNLFDNMTDAGVKVGDKGEDYWPRVVKDYQSLRDLFGQTDGRFEEAFEAARKLTGRQLLTSDEKAEIANKVLQGFGPLKPGAVGPPLARTRIIDQVDQKTVDLYSDPFDSAFRYIDNAAYSAERARFLGKSDDLDESIGRIVQKDVDAGKISEEQQSELHDLMKSRFLADMLSMSKGVKRIRDLIHLTTLGQFRSALTQLNDVALTAAAYGLKNTASAIKLSVGKNRARAGAVMMEDLGIHKYGEEFRDAGKFNKLINRVHQITGFDRFDRLGKEVRANAAEISLRTAAKNPNSPAFEKLRRDYQSTLGPQDFQNTVNDLVAGKRTDAVKYLTFLEVTKLQPIGLEEMPKKYLDMPNGRILYTLKTFMFKQMDLMRRDIFRKLRQPAQFREGLGNLMKYSVYSALIGIGVDALKDWLKGRPFKAEDIPDHAVDIMLNLVGTNRYMADRASKDPVGALADQATPALTVVRDVFSDVRNTLKGKIGRQNVGSKTKKETPGEGIKTIRNIPIAGELLSYWLPWGAGAKRNESDATAEWNSKLKDMKDEIVKDHESDDRPRMHMNLQVYNTVRLDHFRAEMTEWRASGRKGKRPSMPTPLTAAKIKEREE